MKALILTEGGSNLGFGHISRCLGLSEAMLKYAPGLKINFMVNGAIDKIFDFAYSITVEGS